MFDYLAILICVIIGSALTHLLSGLGRLIQLRHNVGLYWCSASGRTATAIERISAG